jgi:phosphatidylinositol-3-phosphatase
MDLSPEVGKVFHPLVFRRVSIIPMTPRLIAPLRLAAALVAAAPAPSAAASAPKHLILIMMENHGTDTLLGNKEDAPFVTELVTQPGVRFVTQYYGVTHPSLPNYLALIAGDEMGIHDDCKAGADIKCKPEEFVPDADESAEAGHLLTEEEERKAADMAHLFPGKTLIDQLDEAKVTWKVYMQGLPADRKTVEYWPLDADGKVVAKLYAQKHNPFVYFSDFTSNPDRMAKLLPDDGFAADLKGDLAGFTWLSPDQCHDMHGISAKTAAVIGAPNCGYPASGLDHSVIRLGDDYLRQTVEAIRSSPVWKDDTAIILVWDEDDYAAAGGLKGSPIGRNGVVLGGGRAPLIVVTSKDNPARKIDAPYNHYNLLATLEAAYGVDCLGHACEAKDALIDGLFE